MTQNETRTGPLDIDGVSWSVFWAPNANAPWDRRDSIGHWLIYQTKGTASWYFFLSFSRKGQPDVKCVKCQVTWDKSGYKYDCHPSDTLKCQNSAALRKKLETGKSSTKAAADRRETTCRLSWFKIEIELHWQLFIITLFRMARKRSLTWEPLYVLNLRRSVKQEIKGRLKIKSNT